MLGGMWCLCLGTLAARASFSLPAGGHPRGRNRRLPARRRLPVPWPALPFSLPRSCSSPPSTTRQAVVDTISKFLPGNRAGLSNGSFALLKMQTGAQAQLYCA